MAGAITDLTVEGEHAFWQKKLARERVTVGPSGP